MAKSTDDKGRPLISRSPRQASRIFGLDQDWFQGSPGGVSSGPPRPRFLFVVRFIRGAGEGSAKWKDGLSFAVRSFSRPKVSPKVQELSQYNKKRLIQTGVNYGPVNIEFHDTVDAAVSYMWNEYASYHFGDFRRQEDRDWKYDVTNQEFMNQDGQGFGFTLPPQAKLENTEEGFFFEKVECYQFFGAQYTQFDLVHPKITSYDPDEMDYEQIATPHGIRMTLEYESIIYHNSYVPANTRENEELTALFGDQIDGDVYEPPGSYSANKFKSAGEGLSAINDFTRGIGKLLGNEKLMNKQLVPEKVTKKLGVLGSFGDFDFGAGVDALLSPVTGPLGRIVGNDLTSVGKSTMGALGDLTADAIGSSRGISAAKFDVAAGQAQKQMGPGAGTQAGLVGAHMASQLTGESVIGTLNTNRQSSSQIGFRTSPPEDPPIV